MKIRGHHLLCILAFRGKGYDEVFTEVMKQVVFALHLNPDMLIEVDEHTDIICGACPQRTTGECGASAVLRDKKALDCLDLEIGDRITWKQILKKLRITDIENMFESVCKDCTWQVTQSCLSKIKEKLETGI